LFLWAILPENPSLEEITTIALYLGCPLILSNTVLYVFIPKKDISNIETKYQVHFKTENGTFKISNIKRGVSIMALQGVENQKDWSIISWTISAEIFSAD
jgi:hypothetical protein